MKKLLLLGALLLGLTTPALAQSIVQDNLSGNEAWSAGQGPGGPGAYITSNLVRNSGAIVAATITTNATLGGGALAPLIEGGTLIITAQPSAATITLPPNPFTNGGIVYVCNPTAAAFATNVVTLAANTGQTVSGGAIALTTLAANTCVRVQFNRATTTWYRTL